MKFFKSCTFGLRTGRGSHVFGVNPMSQSKKVGSVGCHIVVW